MPVECRHTLGSIPCSFVFFFFNDTATTEIYTLSLHDALPISSRSASCRRWTRPAARGSRRRSCASTTWATRPGPTRSEEHTSELQSRLHLVCRLLLEKKKKTVQLKTRTGSHKAESPRTQTSPT